MSDTKTRTPFERMSALNPRWAAAGQIYWRRRRGEYAQRMEAATDAAQRARMRVQWENADAAVQAFDRAFLERRRV